MIAIKIYKNKFKSINVIKIYLIIAKINIYLAIIQFGVNKISGISLVLNYQTAFRGNIFRPCGFFGEPAHLGIFLVALITLKKDIFIENLKFIFITIILLILTGSSVNLMVSILLVIKIMLIYKNKKKLIVYLPILLLVLNLFIYIFPNQFQRNFTVFKNVENTDDSTILRFYKGFIVFKSLDFKEKLLGAGEGDTDYIYKIPSEYFELFNENLDYFSGIGGEIVYLGLIQSILLNIFYYYILGKNNKYFFVSFEILRFGASISYNSIIIPLFVILVSLNSCGNNKEIL
ncbi:hypothetical protein ACV3MX_08475 [Clostridium perfringens]|nr:hypothetical protein [Clostridium perfringens]MDK0589003.1 hypothetical protein [Clostridium perfringens]